VIEDGARAARVRAAPPAPPASIEVATTFATVSRKWISSGAKWRELRPATRSTPWACSSRAPERRARRRRGRAEQRVREAAVANDVRGVRAGFRRAREARERHHDRDCVTARDWDAGRGAHGQEATSGLEVGASGELEAPPRARRRVEDVLTDGSPSASWLTRASAAARRSSASSRSASRRAHPPGLAAPARHASATMYTVPARPGPRGELDPAQPAIGAADADPT
jgi:hypothetical protein